MQWIEKWTQVIVTKIPLDISNVVCFVHTENTRNTNIKSPKCLACMLDLPLGPLRDILRNWLYIEEMANLDDALCNKTQRGEFINMIGSSDFVFTCGNTQKSCAKQQDFINWLVLRKVSVQNLTFPPKYFPLMQSPGKHFYSTVGNTVN